MKVSELFEAESKRGAGLKVHTPNVNPMDFVLATAKKILPAIKKHSPAAYKNFMYPVFRGMNDHGTLLLIDTNKSPPRKSTDNSNHYTVLIDNSPAYKDFPKRSRSIIVSGSPYDAANYAKGDFDDLGQLAADYADRSHDSGLYAVFPADDARIAFFKTDDIHNVDANIFGEPYALTRIAEILNVFKVPADIDAIRKFILTESGSKQFLARLTVYESRKWAEKILTEYTPEQIFSELLASFNPKEQGAKLLSAHELKEVYDDEREGWIQGKSILLSANMWELIKHAVKKGKIKL